MHFGDRLSALPLRSLCQESANWETLYIVSKMGTVVVVFPLSTEDFLEGQQCLIKAGTPRPGRCPGHRSRNFCQNSNCNDSFAKCVIVSIIGSLALGLRVFPVAVPGWAGRVCCLQELSEQRRLLGGASSALPFASVSLLRCLHDSRPALRCP